MAAITNMCSRRLLGFLNTRASHSSYISFQPICIRNLCSRSNPTVIQLLQRKNTSNTSIGAAQICVISPLVCQGRRISSQNTGARGSGSITDDILKSKIGEQPPKDGQDNQDSTGDGDEKKKDSWWSGKNAWKLGLLSLAGMSILMSGNLLLLWGR